jgi:adenosylmethionine-8-amino-7-oxononanoate aminotransferase
MMGKPLKHKVITRKTAYHGTSHGALSLTGIPNMKKAFEPLVPSTFRVPNTNWYRAKDDFATEEEFGLWAANRVEEMIIMEDPDTVAAFFFEPVQNSGGAYTSHPIYFQRVREICDKYDVILVADETIDGFGRTGTMFASEQYNFEPDMLVCAKAITNSVMPLGALMMKEKFYEPFKKGLNIFPHGYTFAASPASCAVALENLDMFDEMNLVGHVQANQDNFKKTLDKLSDLDIVGDVRGIGYFYAIELVKDKETKARFTVEEVEKLLRGFITKDLYSKGLYCRADDRGDPVVQLAPPLTSDQADFDMMESLVRETLTKAWDIVK